MDSVTLNIQLVLSLFLFYWLSTSLGSPGPLFGKVTQGSQSESCLGGWRCKGLSEEVDRRCLRWTAFRKISRPSGRSHWKWVKFEVVVKDGWDCMTAVKNVGMWHRGVERGAEALDNIWRRTDLRQSNVRRQREVSEFVQQLRVRFCFVMSCYCGFYLFSSCDIP